MQMVRFDRPLRRRLVLRVVSPDCEHRLHPLSPAVVVEEEVVVYHLRHRRLVIIRWLEVV